MTSEFLSGIEILDIFGFTCIWAVINYAMSITDNKTLNVYISYIMQL